MSKKPQQDPPIKKNAFVHKLYTMLNDPKLSHLIWWTNHNLENNTFALYPGKEFANALTNYFKHGNVASFVRQLHMYGFHKVSEPNTALTGSSPQTLNQDAPPIWEFKHLLGKFKKDDENSLIHIKRRLSLNSLRSNGYADPQHHHLQHLMHPQHPLYQEYVVYDQRNPAAYYQHIPYYQQVVRYQGPAPAYYQYPQMQPVSLPPHAIPAQRQPSHQISPHQIPHHIQGQPIGQPVGQPVGQPIGQPVGQPVGQPIGQPVGQPIGQPVAQPVGQPVAQPVGQPIGQPRAPPIGQPVGPPAHPVGPPAQPIGQQADVSQPSSGQPQPQHTHAPPPSASGPVSLEAPASTTGQVPLNTVPSEAHMGSQAASPNINRNAPLQTPIPPINSTLPRPLNSHDYTGIHQPVVPPTSTMAGSGAQTTFGTPAPPQLPPTTHSSALGSTSASTTAGKPELQENMPKSPQPDSSLQFRRIWTEPNRGTRPASESGASSTSPSNSEQQHISLSSAPSSFSAGPTVRPRNQSVLDPLATRPESKSETYPLPLRDRLRPSLIELHARLTEKPDSIGSHTLSIFSAKSSLSLVLLEFKRTSSFGLISHTKQSILIGPHDIPEKWTDHRSLTPPVSSKLGMKLPLQSPIPRLLSLGPYVGTTQLPRSNKVSVTLLLDNKDDEEAGEKRRRVS